MSAPAVTSMQTAPGARTSAGQGDTPTGGATVWLTGLSGAGKTTIAVHLATRLREHGRAVEVLDGDELREHLSPGLGFSRADRDAHVRRVGYLARLLARHGVIALVPVIAPYAQARAAIRGDHEREAIDFLEVYVATPVQECARRDVKGLYAAFERGELASLTGLDDPYEAPQNADLVLDTAGRPVAESVKDLEQLMIQRGLS